MPDLKKKLQDLTRKAKDTVYPDKETLRQQWDRYKEEVKRNQTPKK